ARLRRMTATIFDMAVLAGIGVEQRAEAVPSSSGGGCDHPRVAKEAVTDAEVEASAEGHIGGRQRKGGSVGNAHTGGTAGQLARRLQCCSTTRAGKQ